MKKLLFSALLALAVVLPSHAQLPFVIGEIQVEGLQRINEGTVFNYLPLETGDTLTTESAQLAIRELFRTGFFRDIELSRRGNALIISVVERPAISDILITGNRAIATESLLQALGQIGLSEGEVFDRLSLDRMEQELIRQYNSRGKYSVDVDTTVTPLERNRVSLSIVIEEGETAKIKHINIVGNETFEQEEVVDEFESSTTNWLSFWTDDDQYSRDKLSGDLEILRSYYMDRGYLEFELESAQVAITPDKRKIAITANIEEGEVYTVSGVDITGNLVIPEEELMELIEVHPGDVFSRKVIEDSADNITNVLANIGYAFANVTPVPQMEEGERQVSITFFVEPGSRVYVRRIEFYGNYKTRDEVLRREMRQLEGAWFSQAAVERSRVRLQRLGFFSDVTMETPAVPGTDDQVDIHVTVEERRSGTFSGGVGYSQTIGLVLALQLQQRNFLGSGKFVGLGVNTSGAYTNFNLRYVNPYWTQAGVSRGFNIRYSSFDQSEFNITDYSSNTITLGTTFGIPVSEVDGLRFGATVQRTGIDAGEQTSQTILDFLEENGDTFDILTLAGDYIHDSRNDFFFPTQGSLQRFGLAFATPGSNVEFYKLSYLNEFYWPLNDTFTLSFGGEIGYGEGYGDTDELPFFEHFYAGGVDDVRGYEERSLGPRDQFDRPLGGNVKLTGTLSLLFPPPLIDEVAETRMGVFLDFGNVYDGLDNVEFDTMRFSAGIGATWQSPLGVISLSIAYPINDQPGDETEVLQFRFGNVF